MAATDARQVPIKNLAFRAVFPILDADGDLVTGATALDSEVSKDQGTFTDCTNEATEIATASGMYYLDVTATEMNADCVAIIVKTSTVGAKTTVLVLYPSRTLLISSGTAAAIANGTITLESGHNVSAASSVLVTLTGGTAAIGKSRIATYSGSGDVFNVDPAWNAAGETLPSGTITYAIEACPPSPTSTIAAVDVTKWNGTAIAGVDTAGYPKVTVKDGTGTGEIDTASGKVTITAADITSIQTGLATSSSLAAVSAKTDSLTFTTAGIVDANVQQINDVTITGNGSSSPFAV